MTSELKPTHVVEAAGGIPYRWITAGKATGVDERAAKASKFAEARASHTTSKRKRHKHKLPLTQAEIHFRAIITQLEVCLVHRPKYDDWSWPKGKLEEHESSRHAAIREMEEETGVPVALGPSIGEVEYPLNAEGKNSKHAKTGTKTGAIYTKHVVYWMAHPIPPNIAEHRQQAIGAIAPAKASEIDEVRWLTIPQARKLLSHPLDRDILDQFVDRIQEGALKAQKLIIVRHSKAVARKRWEGTDANRPIIPRGAAASFALDQELGCYAPQKLASSPWLRCMETLEPYAWHTGLEIEQLPALTEDAFAADPDATWRCVSDIIDDLFAETDGTSAAKSAVQVGTKAVVKISDNGDSANQTDDNTTEGNPADEPTSDGKTESSTEMKAGSDKDVRDSTVPMGSAVSTHDAQSPSQKDETGNTDAPANDDQIKAATPESAPKQYSRATTICMHRPVIGGIFEHLRAMCASKSLSKQLIAKSPYMPTGNAVALFIVKDAEGPRIIDIQRMAPLVY
ncbi:NUDIX domain-containing protein [Bifidobacterium sp. ESL0775]|uniref:NUDIX domain-containing protein n=1 Tax=Bifidobacterium sp. ESL0775 TaxID=2983230 RepID=UPI0023F72433|nr:NUDIX domain-containing protein [Bifidobacterium sp. ESL0775]WEV69598.1 NUDIX domain-containing protein [Bifidobacterium sp. ESL0775]